MTRDKRNSIARAVRALTLVAAALSMGCTLGPDFTPPPVEAPGQWKTDAAAKARPLPERWWTLFGDGELTKLVEGALQHNQELEAALARVEQARAAAGLARAAQFPALSINPSVERTRFSANREAPPGANHSSYIATSLDLPLDVSYEVDLWGRLRRAREAAGATARATAFDYQSLSLAISSEVARTYFALRFAAREEDVLRDGAELRRRALAIVEGRARAGVGNDLDTSRARVELANVEAELRGVTRGRAALENAIAVLSGVAPADFAPLAGGEPGEAPSVPAGLPSDLLRRRPDIAASIERLHEANARIGQTKAEAYPQLSLTGSAGFVSTELSSLFDPASSAWSLGAALSAPLYRGGAFELRDRAAQAFRDERAADYRATLLVAFREVEDALSALAQIGAEVDWRSQAHAAAQQTFDLADARYRQGLVGYLDVVDAARAELDARRSVVQLERLRAESTVLLIQALGGGWKPEEHGAE